MNKILLTLIALLFPFLKSHAIEITGPESVRAGVMYMIAHKSEIEVNNGRFGVFQVTPDKQVEISFYEKLREDKTYTDTLAYNDETQRRIEHSLFAYDRKSVEIDEIKKQYPELFDDAELICQNAFFPYTICLAGNQP